MAPIAGTKAVARAAVPRIVAPKAHKGLKKAVGTVAGLLPVIAASPALALVDERLNGEGAGLSLGLNDPILGWIMAGAFGTVWALYAATAKDYGAQNEEDGLSL